MFQRVFLSAANVWRSSSPRTKLFTVGVASTLIIATAWAVDFEDRAIEKLVETKENIGIAELDVKNVSAETEKDETPHDASLYGVKRLFSADSASSQSKVMSTLIISYGLQKIPLKVPENFTVLQTVQRFLDTVHEDQLHKSLVILPDTLYYQITLQNANSLPLSTPLNLLKLKKKAVLRISVKTPLPKFHTRHKLAVEVCDDEVTRFDLETHVSGDSSLWECLLEVEKCFSVNLTRRYASDSEIFVPSVFFASQKYDSASLLRLVNISQLVSHKNENLVIRIVFEQKVSKEEFTEEFLTTSALLSRRKELLSTGLSKLSEIAAQKPSEEETHKIIDETEFEQSIESAIERKIYNLQENFSAESKKALKCVKMLRGIVENIIAHPEEEKYRFLSITNAVFQSRVAQYKVALEFLNSIGFKPDDVNLILSENDLDIVLLERAQVGLKRTISLYNERIKYELLMKPIEINADRNIEVYTMKKREIQLPELQDVEYASDDYSDAAILQKLQKELTKKAEDSTKLIPKTYLRKQREEKLLKKGVNRSYMRISVDFLTHSTSVVLYFSVNETVETLYAHIRSLILPENIDFQLKLPPATLLRCGKHPRDTKLLRKAGLGLGTTSIVLFITDNEYVLRDTVVALKDAKEHSVDSFNTTRDVIKEKEERIALLKKKQAAKEKNSSKKVKEKKAPKWFKP